MSRNLDLKTPRLGYPLILLTAIVLLFAASVVVTHTVSAQTTGAVTVTGTATAKITIAIADSSASYGSSLAPDGTGTGGEISSVVSGGATTEGAYYIWTPSTLPLVTVRSNKTWNGTLSATANGGTSASMTVDSGALRFNTSIPPTYASAAASTAFSTTTTSWITNNPKGIETYSYYYFLRVDWDDDPGTFASTVTYSVSQ